MPHMPTAVARDSMFPDVDLNSLTSGRRGFSEESPGQQQFVSQCMTEGASPFSPWLFRRTVTKPTLASDNHILRNPLARGNSLSICSGAGGQEASRHGGEVLSVTAVFSLPSFKHTFRRLFSCRECPFQTTFKHTFRCLFRCREDLSKIPPKCLLINA